MTSDEEGRLWQAEMTANRRRYARWLKHEGRGHRPAGETPAIARARELIRRSRELVRAATALRSRNR